MAWKYNPFTDALDKVGSGGGTSYIDGEVEYHSNLPVTVGTPAVNSAFLVRKGEGLYFISRKPAGIWVRELNNGNLDDWKYAGTFSDLYRDANFRILNNADVSKELAFDVSGVTTGTTRTLTVPNASGTLGWLQSVSSITVSTDHQLTAARNQRVRVNSTSSGSGASVYLPATGNAEGDRLEVACVGLTAGTLSVRTGQYDYTVSASMGLNEQRTFIYNAGAWTVGTVESHTHAGLGPTFASSAFQVTEPSGIVTNRLAFSLSGLTAGATRTLTVPNASGTIALTAQLTNTQIFTANGTWTKPAGAKMVHVFLVGGGAGGGSGRRSASADNAGGGGGGGGAGMWVGWMEAATLGSTETVTVGAGGAGGANRNNDTNGLNGTGGGNTSFGAITAGGSGGVGGGGLNTAGGTGGSVGGADNVVMYGTTSTRASGAAGGFSANATAPLSRVFFAGGGGGGGGKQGATYYTGSAGSNIGTTAFSSAGGAAAVSTAGSNGAASFNVVGTGAGGGSPDSSTGAGNVGGNGIFGSGGGGGSAALNDAGGSTAGGNGGDGIAIITTYF